jgi:uncharacterized protein YndB with AHSA1/START domain
MKWLLYVAGTLAGLALVAAAVLFALGRRADAGRLAAAVEIARPPAEVYAWLTEPDRLTKWVGWLVEVRPVGSGPRGVGSREVWVMDDPNMKQRLEVQGVLTALDPGRRVSARIELPRGFEGEYTYTLAEAGAGRTRVEHVGTYRYHHWFARLLEPVVTRQAQKKLVEDLARLKSLAEAAP